jgi:hypothetical protein
MLLIDDVRHKIVAALSESRGRLHAVEEARHPIQSQPAVAASREAWTAAVEKGEEFYRLANKHRPSYAPSELWRFAPDGTWPAEKIPMKLWDIPGYGRLTAERVEEKKAELRADAERLRLAYSAAVDAEYAARARSTDPEILAARAVVAEFESQLAAV